MRTGLSPCAENSRGLLQSSEHVSCRSGSPELRRQSVESSVYDLLVGRGVVLGRAVFTLRSIETHPLTRDLFWFFCRVWPVVLQQQTGKAVSVSVLLHANEASLEMLWS